MVLTKASLPPFLGHTLALAGSTRRFSADMTDPAQIGFTPDGSVLVVTEKATNRSAAYLVDTQGLPFGPRVQHSRVNTPFGFAFGKRDLVFVSEAFAGVLDGSALSAYSVADRGAVISPSVRAGQRAACWVVVSMGWTATRKSVDCRPVLWETSRRLVAACKAQHREIRGGCTISTAVSRGEGVI
jgi:hypothetical protein